MKLKSSVAALSAGALGLVGATIGAAPASAAAPVCATWDDYVDGIPASGPADFFADCVPQYGLGKAEFTITSDSPIPEGFTDLTELEPTSTTIDGAAFDAYFAGSELAEAPVGISAEILTDSTETTRTYLATSTVPVAGAEALPSVPSDLALMCGAGGNTDPVVFTGAYRVDFAASSSTFSQLIDGEDWSWTITVPARSAWYLVGAGFFDDVTSFELCATDGIRAFSTLDDDTTAPLESLFIIPFTPEFPNIGAGPDDVAFWDLGPFARFVPTPVVPPLPATGLETAAPAGIAVGLVAIGALALAGATVVRRRRDASV